MVKRLLTTLVLALASTAQAGIYANETSLQILRERGLNVMTDDQVRHGCWKSPDSAENTAISLLDKYHLYNQNSHVMLQISARGYRTQGGSGICAASYDIIIYQNIPNVGFVVYGGVSGISTGREASDHIRSEVEKLIDELVSAFGRENI
jgi:hypothetical protein